MLELNQGVFGGTKTKTTQKKHEKTMVVIGFCRKVPKNVMVVNGLMVERFLVAIN
jgi:hypothetical protein